jgi:hypothetical protein
MLDELRPGSNRHVSEKAKKYGEQRKNYFLNKRRVCWQEGFAK